MRVGIRRPSGLCATVRITGVIVEVLDATSEEVGGFVRLTRIGINCVAIEGQPTFIRAVVG